MDKARKRSWKWKFFIVSFIFAVVDIALIVIQGLGVNNRAPYVFGIIGVFVLGVIVLGFMSAKYKREIFEEQVKQRTQTVKSTLINYKSDNNSTDIK